MGLTDSQRKALKEKIAKVPAQPKVDCPNKGKSPQKNDTDSVKVKCEHRNCPDDKSFFEIVPTLTNTTPYKDSVTVTWTGPNKPPGLKVSNFGEVKGGGTYKIDFKDAFDSFQWEKFSKPGNREELNRKLLKEMFTYSHVKEFSINGLPNGSLPINFYNPEKWSIAFKFPSFKSYKKGKKLDTVIKGTNKGYVTRETETSKSTWGYSESKTITKEKDDRGKPIQQRTDSGKFAPDTQVSKSQLTGKVSAIEIKRNGSPLQLSVFDSIQNILRIVNLVRSVYELINEFVPQIGWYAEADVQFLQGNLSVEWGWREYTAITKAGGEDVDTHQAVFGVKVEGDIKIVKAKCEVGLGVKAIGFQVQVFAFIEGEISFKPSFDKYAPNDAGMKLAIDFSISGEIGGGGGARVEAGYFYKLELTIETGLYINGNLKILAGSEDPVRIEGHYGFKGIVGKVTQSINEEAMYGEQKSSPKSKKDQKKIEKKDAKISFGNDLKPGEKVFLPPKDFGNFQWPSEDKDMAKELDEDEIKSMLESMLSGKMMKGGIENKKDSRRELKFTYSRKSGLITLESEYLKESDIAVWMTQKIIRHKNMAKTRKSIEGVCYEIRGKLEQYIIEDWNHFDYILNDDLQKFIFKGPLDQICDGNIDPVKEAFS